MGKKTKSTNISSLKIKQRLKYVITFNTMTQVIKAIYTLKLAANQK